MKVFLEAVNRRNRLAAVLRGYLSARRASKQSLTQLRSAGASVDASKTQDKLAKNVNRLQVLASRTRSLSQREGKHARHWAKRSFYQVLHVAHRPRKGFISRARIDRPERPANPKTYGKKNESSGYPITAVSTDIGRGRKLTHYRFKHRTGSGEVVINHAPGVESKVDFKIKRSDYTPDLVNARNILKTVEKAVRHHLVKEKPRAVGYLAITDAHDRRTKNRRDNIYQRIAAKLAGKRWKEISDASPMVGRRKFIRMRSGK